MSGYARKIEEIQAILYDFIQKRTIDSTRLGPLDELVRSSEADQLRILNTSRLSLDEQRSIFGAVRNTYSAVKMMKARLMTAAQRHENPTVADLSLEMIQSLSNLAPYIDEYVVQGRTGDMKTMVEFSRILHKKAKHLGFCEDVATQLKEINIAPDEIKTFVERLNENIELETGTDEDVGPRDESNR